MTVPFFLLLFLFVLSVLGNVAQAQENRALRRLGAHVRLFV
ncbi:MAG: hypothetical protein ACYDHY_06940 [Acidiferrobacterales bacterium]